MRFGTRLGLAAVVLIVLGSFINRNFGIGDSRSVGLIPMLWESAPAAVLISLVYLILLVLCVLLSALLITTSLVIRHAEASEEATTTTESASDSL
ncbi:hypothetical protein NNX28_16275 [Arthrobacter sp. zg-Y859]|uniref:Uncharacterized protein n=1 Tax=Arthrobacter jinronghuae TaxID=2964609 RepID=A0ABT1NXP8_9MICC|nr:hypothetical protein [Arthrobacter jinronghuae]MCQ1951479.1 hypothetical protein [Arthrobacter jinronghuae]UWX78881.1 hypothetical protein N2K98_01285 [Arthrobacter jinronghuae]